MSRRRARVNRAHRQPLELGAASASRVLRDAGCARSSGWG